MHRDMYVLAVLLVGFLCVGGGLIASAYYRRPSYFLACTVPGGTLIVGSTLVVRRLRYSCPSCGNGHLSPIAAPEDRVEVRYSRDGGHGERKVSQYYDCDVCGHREWLEH